MNKFFKRKLAAVLILSMISALFLINVSGAAVIAGDINGDGVVNNKDVTVLSQFLAGWNVNHVPATLDVNGDGAVNTKDASALMRYLAGWDVTLHVTPAATTESTTSDGWSKDYL